MLSGKKGFFVFFNKCPNTGLAILLLKRVFSHVSPDESIIYEFFGLLFENPRDFSHPVSRNHLRRHFWAGLCDFPALLTFQKVIR
jgi:hypothetical protein